MTERKEETTPEDLGVKFVAEAVSRLGLITDKHERALLMGLTTHLDTSAWGENEYKAFAQLFSDYRDCLSILGPAEREIGLKVSSCIPLFEKPVASLECSFMVSCLIDIARTRPTR